MQLLDVVIAWNPNGTAKVGPHLDPGRWSKNFQVTDGADNTRWARFDENQRQKALFIVFHTMVVRDGVDVQVAHRAFMEIDEYRDLIAQDIEGPAI